MRACNKACNLVLILHFVAGAWGAFAARIGQRRPPASQAKWECGSSRPLLTVHWAVHAYRERSVVIAACVDLRAVKNVRKEKKGNAGCTCNATGQPRPISKARAQSPSRAGRPSHHLLSQPAPHGSDSSCLTAVAGSPCFTIDSPTRIAPQPAACTQRSTAGWGGVQRSC